jgi:type I restriction enzyme, S subunit
MKVGWITGTLGNTCDMYQPKTISVKEMVEDGAYPVFGANGVIGRYDKFNHEERQLLITCRGATCGAVNVSEPKSWITGNAMVVRPKDGSIDLRFLEYVFRGGIDISKAITGSAQPQITRTNLAPLEISYPINIEEQQRIVGILDEAFKRIATAKANAEKNLQNARALFESLSNAAIQGNLIAHDLREGSATELTNQIEEARNLAIIQGRAKPDKTEPVENSEERQSRLPKSWKWAQLGSLTVGISDGVHKKPHYISKGIPFITVRNLTEGQGISFDNVNYITQEDHEEFIKRTHPEKGDILITKDGTIGVVRLIETDIEFSLFVSVALIKPVMQELGPYLAYALRASCVQSQMVPQGAALKHIYLVDLRRLSIPLPPLAEQKRIVVALDSLNTEIQGLLRIYENKLTLLEELKKSLLHRAFSGQF